MFTDLITDLILRFYLPSYNYTNVCKVFLYCFSIHLSFLLPNFSTTIVWEKFIVGNFHVEIFRVKIFSSSWIADEIF